MSIEKTNRFTVSRSLRAERIIICALIGILLINQVLQIIRASFSWTSILSLVIGGVVLIFMLYVFRLKRRIDYDDILETMFIVDLKSQTEVQIPVERIEKILYSAIGLRATRSYVIVYRDWENRIQKFRFFPILSDHSIKTIIDDTRRKNSKVVIRNWSVGLNELTD